MTPRPTAEERAEHIYNYLIAGITAKNPMVRISAYHIPGGFELITKAILEAEAAVREECARIAEMHGQKGGTECNIDFIEGACIPGPNCEDTIADAIRKAGKK